MQNEINQLGYLMECAGRRGLKIVLNPSPMNEKIFKLPLEMVDYFLLNEIEAQQILGKEEGAVDGPVLAGELKARFPRAAIVLTLGREGSIYMDEKETIHQQIYPVAAVDTTAAGDTFTGFFIGGLIRGLNRVAAMDQAARASSIAVSRPGAAASIPELREVEEAAAASGIRQEGATASSGIRQEGTL